MLCPAPQEQNVAQCGHRSAGAGPAEQLADLPRHHLLLGYATRSWAGKKTAWLSIFGFAATIFCYLGVNLVLSVLHSYGGGNQIACNPIHRVASCYCPHLSCGLFLR